jgi:hypothetical protein
MKPGPLLFGLVAALVMATPLCAQTLAQPAASEDCGSSQSCSVHLASNVTAGNTLIAVVRIGQVTSVSGTTITDTMANTWVLDAYQAQTADVHLLAVYRAATAKAGSTTFTVSNKAAQTMRIISLSEISGLASGSPDAALTAAGSGTLAKTNALTTSHPGDYVLVAASTANNQSFSTTQPFHIESQATKGAYADADAAATQTSTMTPSIAFSVSDEWAAVSIAYESTATAQIPIDLTLKYDDGSPVAGTAVLSSLANNTKTTLQTWTIGSNGAVTIYCPKVNTGTYEYDFRDPSGNILQSYVILPGAFISLITPAHSILGSITLSKANHAVVIPVSFAFQ